MSRLETSRGAKQEVHIPKFEFRKNDKIPAASETGAHFAFEVRHIYKHTYEGADKYPHTVVANFISTGDGESHFRPSMGDDVRFEQTGTSLEWRSANLHNKPRGFFTIVWSESEQSLVVQIRGPRLEA